MNQKQIGSIILIVGILVSVFVYLAKVKEDSYINNYIKERNTCYLESGLCLHDNRSFNLYIAGFSVSVALILFSVYLIFFDKTQRQLAENQTILAKVLNETAQNDKFSVYVKGFSEDEQKILLVVHDQDGIKQSTLRYKTGLSKTTLSLTLKSLEERGIISRKSAGKTNQVYLIKKF